MSAATTAQAIEKAEQALRKTREEIAGAIEALRVTTLIRATDELEDAVRDHRLEDAVRLQKQIENLIRAVQGGSPYDPDGPISISGKPRK